MGNENTNWGQSITGVVIHGGNRNNAINQSCILEYVSICMTGL